VRAGLLTQRVTLERPVETRDPNFGTAVKAWQPVATVWAAVDPISGRDYLANREPGAELTVRVRVRHSPEVAAASPKWRVNLGGTPARLLQVDAVINPRSANTELQLMCTDTGQG